MQTTERKTGLEIVDEIPASIKGRRESKYSGEFQQAIDFLKLNHVYTPKAAKTDWDQRILSAFRGLKKRGQYQEVNLLVRANQAYLQLNRNN